MHRVWQAEAVWCGSQLHYLSVPYLNGPQIGRPENMDHELMVPEIMSRDHGLMVPEQMANLANHFFPWRGGAFWNQPFSSFGFARRDSRLTNDGSFDPPQAFGLSRVGIYWCARA